MQEVNALLEKYDNFKGAMMRSIEQREDGSKIITIVLQDDDGEDLNSVSLEFTNITSSKLVIDSVLAFMDMGLGITIIKEHDYYGFALGRGTSLLDINSSPVYIVAANLKIQDNK
ncbi:MAG: hypothetical protein Q9M32_01800 [Sulfurimonas sp.]|nr:hypothetical protein [Sulfurimonas sp.]MDQ7060321.1 hypothetical protein [Sulfurimonas sp.]